MYNSKINHDGAYAPFYGYTVICNCKNDMKIIENYLRYNRYISYYFSPLPSSSYHVTLYNIWCNFKELLNPQKDIVAKNPSLKSRSKELGFFNPENCLNPLFKKISDYCSTHVSTFELVCDKIVYTGGTIALIFKINAVVDNISSIRKDLTNIVGKSDGMGRFHMTLGYKYKDIDQLGIERLEEELYILNCIIRNTKIVFESPKLNSFESMLSFEQM